MDSIGKQIGGNHYLKMGKQPVELAGELNLTFFQGSVLKYISRKKESIVEDLAKAAHFCQLGEDLDENTSDSLTDETLVAIKEYVCTNDLDERYIQVLEDVFSGKYPEAEKTIRIILEEWKEKLGTKCICVTP